MSLKPLAFPTSTSGGMFLRDYFAGQALTGYIAAPDFGDMTAAEVAEHCYATADALLAERERGK